MNITSRSRWPPVYSLVVAATLFAVFMRFWCLSSLPPQAWYDEIWFALRARDLIQTGQLHAHYGVANTAGNAGLVYLTALVQLFGVESIVSARVAIALAGVVAIPLTYTCLSNLLGEEVELAKHRRGIAALAAVISSYLLFAVILSREGMEPILALPVALFVLWQVTQGTRHGRWRSWTAAGLIAGLALYNGPHSQLATPLAAYLIFERYFGKGNKVPRRAILKGALAMMLTILLVALPLVITFVQHPGWMTGRAVAVSQPIVQETEQAGPLATFGANGLHVLGSWLLAGDTNPRHNLPGQPMLDPILAIGFVVGIGWSIWRFRRSQIARLLLIWMIWMALPAALTIEAPNMQRMVGVIPPTVTLIAVGWWQLGDWLRHHVPSYLHRWGLLLGLSLLLASLAWNMHLFWRRWPYAPRLHKVFMVASADLGRELAHRADTEQVYVESIPGRYDIASFEYYFDGKTIPRADFSQCLPLVQQNETRTSYLLLASANSQTVGRLQSAYPDSQVTIESMPIWTSEWFGEATLLEVPAGAAVPRPMYRSRVDFSSGLSLYGYDIEGVRQDISLQAGDNLSMIVYWQAVQPVTTGLTALVHLVPAGIYDQPPLAQHDGPPCFQSYPTSEWETGKTVMDWFDIPLPVDLPPGDYELAAGWYNPETMERDSAVEADYPLPDGRAVIGKIEVTAP